jgi:hypothetical protein
MTSLTNSQLTLIMSILWTISGTLMFVQTVTPHYIVGQWAIMIALGACVATGSIIVRGVAEKERLRTERIVELVTEKVRQEAKLERIR